MNEYIIQPYKWSSEDKKGEEQCIVSIWGHNRNSERVLIKITDFKPFCRIELQQYRDGKKIIWDHKNIQAYANYLKFVLSSENHSPCRFEFSELKNLYTYREGANTPYLTCWFDSENAMNHCCNLVSKPQPCRVPGVGPLKCTIRERSITTVHKMLVELNIGYGQWLSIKGDEVDDLDRETFKTIEATASWLDIKPVDDEICKSWIVDPMVVSIDIECYSSNHNTMPNALHIADCITMISLIFQRLNDNSTRQKILLTLKGCGEIEGAIVKVYKTEIEMLNALGELFIEYDPSVITGYNINKFDIPYLNVRFSVYISEWPNCSCKINGSTKVNTSSWESSAYGTVHISKIEAEGRITVDMYTIILREYGNKLERRTLDYVSKYFLNRGKHDVSALEMFRTYKELIDAINSGGDLTDVLQKQATVGKYCLEDSILCIDLMKHLNTYIGLTELCTIVDVQLEDTFGRGQQLRVENQIYRVAKKEGYVIDSRNVINDKFKGGFVVDPIPGKYKYILIFDFASLYPSIIRAYNICYTTLVPDMSDIPDESCNVIEWEETFNEGKEDEYRKNFRFRFIKKEIHEGLLPRMCASLVNKRKDVRAKINPNNDAITNIILDQRQNALKVSANSIFGALGVRDGKVPLLEGAASITAMGRMLNYRCQDYVLANTSGKIVYGDTDSIMVDLQLKDPHECKILGDTLSKGITESLGRFPLSLEFERSLATALFIGKKLYAGYPMTFVDKDSKKQKVISFELIGQMKEMKNMNVYSITWIDKMKDDKQNNLFLAIPEGADLVNHSYYAGFEVNKSCGILQKLILKKGIVIARRDRCKWVRNTYSKALMSILFDRDWDFVRNQIDEDIYKLINFRIPTEESPLGPDELSIEDLIVTAEVKTYKPTATCKMKSFKDIMLMRGMPLEVGERIATVMVVSVDPEMNSKQGYKMRLLNDYMNNRFIEPIDKNYYIENSLMKPLEVIINLAYKDIIARKNQVHKMYGVHRLMERPTKEMLKHYESVYAHWDLCKYQVKQSIYNSSVIFTPGYDTLVNNIAECYLYKRGKMVLDTYSIDKYINMWTVLIKRKDLLNKHIAHYRAHFRSQDPYFTENLNNYND